MLRGGKAGRADESQAGGHHGSLLAPGSTSPVPPSTAARSVRQRRKSEPCGRHATRSKGKRVKPGRTIASGRARVGCCVRPSKIGCRTVKRWTAAKQRTKSDAPQRPRRGPKRAAGRASRAAPARPLVCCKRAQGVLLLRTLLGYHNCAQSRNATTLLPAQICGEHARRGWPQHTRMRVKMKTGEM